MHSQNNSWRTCIGCRESANPSELIRFAYDEGRAEIRPDWHRRMPGRGAWIHPREACIKRASKKGAFHRALRIAERGSHTTISVDISARNDGHPTHKVCVADE